MSDDTTPQRQRRDLTLRPTPEAELTTAALITPEDIARAQAQWKRDTVASYAGLLDAV